MVGVEQSRDVTGLGTVEGSRCRMSSEDSQIVMKVQ